jgi:DNA-directed RNA polymerase subunit RPC12/RpoP
VSSPSCLVCGAEALDGRSVCRACPRAAGRALTALWHQDRTDRGIAPSLLDELDTTLTRQTRVNAGAAGRSADRPLPYDERAAKVRADIIGVLGGAARAWQAPEVVLRIGRREPRALARWLGINLPVKLGWPSTPAIVADLIRLHLAAVEAVDRPLGAWYAGRCVNCGGDLYAGEGAAAIRCRACGARIDVQAQREHLLAKVNDALATAAEISRAVHLTPRPVSPSMLNRWVARGMLTRRGKTVTGEHLYRVGDVLDLATVVRPRRAV